MTPWLIADAVRSPDGVTVVLELSVLTDSGKRQSVEVIVEEAPPNFEACVGTEITGDKKGTLLIAGKPWLQRVGRRGNRLRLVPKGRV